MPCQAPTYAPTLPDSHAWLARCTAECAAADNARYLAKVEVLRAPGVADRATAQQALDSATTVAQAAWVRYRLAQEEIREGPLPFDPRERAQVQAMEEQVRRKGYRMQQAARALLRAAEGPAKQEARAALHEAERVHTDACAELQALRLRIRAARPPRRLALP